MKESLLGKNLKEIEQVVINQGWPKYTAKQLSEWLYGKKVSEFGQMTNLSKKIRRELEGNYLLGPRQPKSVTVSGDGTKKYLFPVLEDNYVEAAYIPEKDRATLCISTQVGCRMGCFFCMTARQKFQGNLTAGDIINQVTSLPERDCLTNIVYMGMGEPFDNFKEVMKSLEIITSGWGFGWSPKRITVSTIGIIPAMNQFIENSLCHLAVSLHSPFDEERQQLMPVQLKYPVKKVVESIKQFDLGKQRRVSFEYILFKDINDTPHHVKELARLLDGLRCRVNLLRFHDIPGSAFVGSKETTIQQFKDGLNRENILTTIRKSRGQDIEAACGLLSTRENEKSK